MRVYHVKYVCKDGLREAFLKAIQENKIDYLCQHEEGNLQYEYSFSVDDPNVLILTEVWESAEALQAHAQTEHLKKLGEMKKDYVLETSIEKFEAERI